MHSSTRVPTQPNMTEAPNSDWVPVIANYRYMSKKFMKDSQACRVVLARM